MLHLLHNIKSKNELLKNFVLLLCYEWDVATLRLSFSVSSTTRLLPFGLSMDKLYQEAPPSNGVTFMGFLMTWNGERNHLTAVISIKTKRYKDFANARELQMTRNLQYHRIQQQMITNLITKKKKLRPKRIVYQIWRNDSRREDLRVPRERSRHVGKC